MDKILDGLMLLAFTLLILLIMHIEGCFTLARWVIKDMGY